MATYVPLGKDGAIGKVITIREMNPITQKVTDRQKIMPINQYRIDLVGSGLQKVMAQLELQEFLESNRF
jgi:hypothetical protein